VADGPKNQGTEKESLFAGIPAHLYHPCAAIDVDQFMNGTNGINDVQVYTIPCNGGNIP
jgi:hypothetical protein